MSSHLDSFKERSDINTTNERQIIELNALFEVSNQVSSSLELSQILNNTLFLIMGRMLISKAAIFLYNSEDITLAECKGIKFEAKKFTGTLNKLNPYFTDEVNDKSTN